MPNERLCCDVLELERGIAPGLQDQYACSRYADHDGVHATVDSFGGRVEWEYLAGGHGYRFRVEWGTVVDLTGILDAVPDPDEDRGNALPELSELIDRASRVDAFLEGEK